MIHDTFYKNCCLNVVKLPIYNSANYCLEPKYDVHVIDYLAYEYY